MPEKETMDRRARMRAKGNREHAAGEFVREEIHTYEKVNMGLLPRKQADCYWAFEGATKRE